jgi:hypothetical protein
MKKFRNSTLRTRFPLFGGTCDVLDRARVGQVRFWIERAACPRHAFCTCMDKQYTANEPKPAVHHPTLRRPGVCTYKYVPGRAHGLHRPRLLGRVTDRWWASWQPRLGLRMDQDPALPTDLILIYYGLIRFQSKPRLLDLTQSNKLNPKFHSILILF